MVKVLCYGKVKEYETREKAIKHFLECQTMSEGAERERYTNILCDLQFTTRDFVYDYEDEYELYLKSSGNMEKYFEILDKIEKEKVDIVKLFILSCLDTDNKELALEQLDYIYDLWLDIDEDISLARLADIVSDQWEKIENGEMEKDDIINLML